MPANTEIEGAVSLAPPDIDLSPDRIEFGRVFVPLSLTASYHGGKWGPMRVDRLSNFNLHPASTVFHYAQSIFEGLKAYRWADGSVNLFRPSENAARFARSATRMAIPPINEADFVEGIRALVDLEREWIPVEPGSLYIRPVIIATEPCLGVRAAHDFLYFVITLPTGAYFPQLAKSAGTGTVRVYVTTTVGRAAHGGTGNVKAAANYAVTLQVTEEAKKKGCSQVLFLDSAGKGRVEEMGGMNICFVRGGKLITPSVSDTILPGVTRNSVLQLAGKMGVPFEEGDIPFHDLLDEIRSGAVTEAFACGTAAVVVGIDSFLLDSGEEVRIGNGQTGPLTADLYRQLTDIQYGRAADPFNWIVKV